MKDMDEMGLKLCGMQAEVFAASCTETECSSAIFVRRFMYSQVAARMDAGGFLFEACDVHTILDELNEEFGPSAYGKEKYSIEELYWMGYIYRYWSYIHEKTSKQVYRIIKPRELSQLYFPYHSLDPAQAIERILEAEQLDEQDQIAKGVAVLRAAMERERKREK